MPDADGLRQRAEQALHGRLLPETPTWELWAVKVAMPLIRDLLVAVGDQRLQAQFRDYEIGCIVQALQKAAANEEFVQRVVRGLSLAARAEAADAQRQGLQTRIAALVEKWRIGSWQCRDQRILNSVTVAAEACLVEAEAIYRECADELATLIQPGAAQE